MSELWHFMCFSFFQQDRQDNLKRVSKASAWQSKEITSEVMKQSANECGPEELLTHPRAIKLDEQLNGVCMLRYRTTIQASLSQWQLHLHGLHHS